MKRYLNPKNKDGERNIYCPFYRDCLDLVIKKSWEYWACSNCRHRKQKVDFFDSLPSMDNGMPYYSLSHNINLEALDA
jgi:hypothetical protein